MEATGQINRRLDDRRWGEETWRIHGIAKSAIGVERALRLMVLGQEELKTMMGFFICKYINGFLFPYRIEFLT